MVVSGVENSLIKGTGEPNPIFLLCEAWVEGCQGVREL